MLKTLDAGVILVAHDRWFLEAVTTAVLELEGGKSVYFPGAWHVWRREQAARAIHQAKTADRQAEQIARLERFVERFRYKATKARQAQSKLKQIDKLEADRVLRAGPARGAARLRVPEAGALRPRRGRRRGPRRARGRQAAARRAAFAIERGEHVALVGPNGSGKTTLLETLLGLREPDGGKLRLGHGVEPAYFSQHEAELDERGSVLDAAMSGTGLSGRRRRTCSAASSSRAGTSTRSGSPRSRAASGGGLRSRSSSPRARTSSCSTSRRTISTSNRASRSRRRSRRFPGPCCSSRTTARCSTRSPTGCSRSRTQRSRRTRAAGPTTCARRKRGRSAAAARRRSRRSRSGAKRPAKAKPSALELVEARGRARRSTRRRAGAEARRRLGRRRAARGPQTRRARISTALLKRWEALFESSGSTTP